LRQRSQLRFFGPLYFQAAFQVAAPSLFGHKSLRDFFQFGI